MTIRQAQVYVAVRALYPAASSARVFTETVLVQSGGGRIDMRFESFPDDPAQAVVRLTCIPLALVTYG